MSQSDQALRKRDTDAVGQATERLPPMLGELRNRDFLRDVRLLAIMRALQRRRWLIAGVLVACMGSAVAYNALATKVYEARARLLIEPESAQVTLFRPLVPEDQGRVDYFVTQMEVLRSRALARQTLDALQLLSTDPQRQSAQIDAFMGSLTVSPVRTVSGESRVVSLTFRSPVAATSAQLANRLAKAFVDQNLDVRREGSRQASKWLIERLAELRQQVTVSQQELQKYRERSDAVSLEDPQNIVQQKLAQLNTAVTSARTERVEKQAIYEQLEAARASGVPLDTLPQILSNTFVQGLKSELAGLQRERLQQADRLGPSHPDMVKLDAAIANARQRLDAEMSKVVEGLRNDYVNVRARERGLVAALNEQKQQVLALSQQSIGYAAIQRDAASTQQIFESILQRVKETDLSAELQTNNARILDVAEVPRSPIWPRPQLNLMVALLVGCFGAFGLAIGLEYLNPRIARPDDVSEALGVPLLGTAPKVAGLQEGVRADELPPIFLEALRAIRTRILLSPVTSVARTLAVTSTNPGEGKTMVASSLAVSLAAAGKRVLLIDADMRRPQQHRVFDTVRSPGLANVLAGQVKASDALVRTVTPGLFVLPAGAGVERASDLLDSERLKQIISEFGDRFDLVILDSPPVLAVADASIIGNAVSAVLFVVAAGQTSRDVAQLALDRLGSVQAYVAGVVLNKFKHDRHDYYYAEPHDYQVEVRPVA